MEIDGFGGVDLKVIEKFQKNRGILLPEDYKNFLLKYNGGTPKIKYSTFRVKELSTNIILDCLYGLNVEKRQLDLEYINDEFGDEDLSEAIIIGDDPGSGFIVLLNYEKLKGIIYYLDDEFNFEQSTEENNMYKISDSIKEFIDSLEEPKEK